MIGALMGVPGRLKTLLDRLTSTRATALDNLDAAISTRASASVWTGALATELDGLAPAIAAIPTTPINSIQYNTVTISDTNTSGTRTLGTTVNAAKSVLVYLGGSYSASTMNASVGRITLTSGTTVTADRGGTSGNLIISFCVVEFK